jgi:predicted protein tyrosine phosphatase
MSRQIYVTSLFEMPQYVRMLRPSHLISIIQPAYQPDRPGEIDDANHHRVVVDDISEPTADRLLIDSDDVRALVDFIHTWEPDSGSLLVHCYAGVSRSTATALIAHVINTGDPLHSAMALRRAAPHARPNRLMVILADEVLKLDGALIAALEIMGDATQSVVEAPLTSIDLD